MSYISDSKSVTYEEDAKKQVWKDAMAEKYKSIMKNGVWEVVPKPEVKTIVTSIWIYKIKHVVNGHVEKYKSKFVAHGFYQKEGIGYDETFTHVARYTNIQDIISLAFVLIWKFHQMDVKTSFLNNEVEEQVYIQQTERFVVYGKNPMYVT